MKWICSFVLGLAFVVFVSPIVNNYRSHPALQNVQGVLFEGSPEEEEAWHWLVGIAAAQGVEVKLVDTPTQLGMYFSDEALVVVSTGFGPPDIQLYVLAHEVGHAVAGLQASQVALILHSFLGIRMDSVCSDEKAAWYVGRALLEKIGWSRWNRFEELRELALGTYRCL